jgi:hypothetical protein
MEKLFLLCVALLFSVSAASAQYVPPGGSGGGNTTATYVTQANETANLPNSYQVVAGTNITLTPSGSTLTISSSGGSASAGGTNGQIQFNSSGALGGFTASGGATVNTTTGVVTLGNPGASTKGGIESLAAVTSNWINAISTSGVPSATQPAFTDISGTATAAQEPATTVNSTGNLSPIFTSSISAQALSFSITNAGAGTVFGNFGASSGAPSYNAVGSLYTHLSVTGAGGLAYTFGLDGEQEPSTGATLTATSPSIVDYNTGGGGGTYTLPVSTTCLGKWFVFNKFALGNFTAQTQGGDVFVGDASTSSNSGGRYAAYLSNGNGTWISISPTIQQITQGGTGANAATGNSIVTVNSGATAQTALTGTSQIVSFNGSSVPTAITLVPIANGGTGTATGLSLLTVRVVTAAGAVTVATSDGIVVINKTTGAATTVNLPASPATGLQFIIKDGKGDANTNNITVTPNAGNIDNAATYVINANLGSINIVYDGSQWRVF